MSEDDHYDILHQQMKGHMCSICLTFNIIRMADGSLVCFDCDGDVIE